MQTFSDPRKLGIPFQKSHPAQSNVPRRQDPLAPTGTPLATAAALEAVRAEPQAENSTILGQMPDAETTLRLVARGLGALADVQSKEFWRVPMLAPGLVVSRTDALLQTLINSSGQTLQVVLSDGDGSAGFPHDFTLTPGAPLTGLRLIFPARLYVASMQTTTGASATATATVGGTFAAGQVYSLTLTDPATNLPYPISYTAISGDTNNAGVATKLATAIAAAAPNLVTAAAVGAVVTITAKTAGSAGNAISISTLAATGTGTLAATHFGGAVTPALVLAGEYV